VFELSVKNEYGDVLALTGNPDYDVLSVSGLNPAPAEINTTPVSGIDGTRYNSARIGQRNIVICLNINGDIEDRRIELYRYFRVKHTARVYYKNEHADVYIDGYIETFENDFFTILQQPQISIICPDPYFKSMSDTEIDFENVTALFTFPFAIAAEGIPFSSLNEISSRYFNAGNVETGGIITFTALADGVKNPIFYNNTNSTFFGVDITMQSGDVIEINTQRGEKSVKLTRSGVTTSIVGDRTSGSTWIVFEPGENEISFGADVSASSLRCTLSCVQRFEGV
jgi:predicted phage tail component-like protein